MICLTPWNNNIRHVTIKFNGNEILDVWCNNNSGGDVVMVMHSVPESPTCVYTDPKHLLLHKHWTLSQSRKAVTH
jgi:hypothetical protein